MRLHVDSPRVSLDALTHVDSPRVSVDATSRIESSSSDSSGTCSNPFRIFLHQSSSDSVKRYNESSDSTSSSTKAFLQRKQTRHDPSKTVNWYPSKRTELLVSVKIQYR